MLEYPSVPRAMGQQFREMPNAHVFDKLDGSSMRSEWSRKRGFYKLGRRHGLLDNSNIALDQVPGLFESTLREPLERLAHDKRWDNLIVFYEFWGVQSLGGLHVLEDPKFLTVFDASVNRGDILPPDDFRKSFEDVVPTARFLGRVNWTRGYVDLVRTGQVEGVTSEGVVGKMASKRGIERAKAKTQVWIDRIMQVHGEVAGKRIVES